MNTEFCTIAIGLPQTVGLAELGWTSTISAATTVITSTILLELGYAKLISVPHVVLVNVIVLRQWMNPGSMLRSYVYIYGHNESCAAHTSSMAMQHYIFVLCISWLMRIYLDKERGTCTYYCNPE